MTRERRRRVGTIAPIAAVLLLVRWGASAECSEEGTASGVLAAIRRGDYECAIASAKATGGRYENEVTLELRGIEKALKEIKEAVKPAATGSLAPAYQWAQSGSEIFISVKFAHKLDAPATLVNSENINEVSFSDKTVVVKAAKSSKRFVLELELLRSIEPANCTWSSASVGRATVTLRKASAFREWWPRLLASKTKPANQHVWWDKQEAFTEEQEEVEKEEKLRAKEAKKKPKEEQGGTNETSNETAAEPIEEESPEVKEEKEKQKALNKRKAEIRKSFAAKKKEVEDEARDEKRAINDETKQRIADVDETLRKKRDAVDAEMNAALEAVDAPLVADEL